MNDMERSRLEALIHRWSCLQWQYKALADYRTNEHAQTIAIIYGVCIQDLSAVLKELAG